ncbi:TIGR03643 family protein [Rhizobium oryziradicis]|uniref:TIGR03643 family protein n=1 Tax=Rhizobium oryziradicis TaxID=1867956 RepID=A0A1Q8ZKV9_9HYPH|nr:TIGR03643 family protein [Rhizobium oryziradicis]OLP42495.1 TIGR03643 family protein [Rhizobium oryziradicis]
MIESDDSIRINRIIDLAWADDVSFDQIKRYTGLNEAQVIRTMRQNLKPASFRIWRQRVSGRAAKHERKSRLQQQTEA